MFYSTTFLARKGPLGTVWIAAHLQHRLRKSHYASIRISETVDEIMCPAVPIALRMSGHLLLGVARIYAKKVDYLFQDCNHALTSLIKAFSSIEVNLPENLKQAPVHSITLPERFDLDALELDYDIHSDRLLDDHLRDPEDITLPDQISFDRESYIAVTFDEDISAKDVSHGDDVRPMDEDIVTPSEVDSPPRQVGDDVPPQPEQGTERNLGVSEPGGRDSDNHSPQSVPEYEVMRDASHDLGPEPFDLMMPEYGNITADNQNIPFNQNSSGKRIPSPVIEEIFESGGHSVPFQLQPEPPSSIPAQDAPGTDTTTSLFRYEVPELAVRSTPIQPPRPRRRKRQLDKATVLSNKFMKKGLEDCSDLKRKRSKPCGALQAWKRSVRLRREQIVDEPLTTGFPEILSNVLKKDFISTKPHLVKEISTQPSASGTISFRETGNLGSDASVLNPEFIIPETHSPARATESFSELGMEPFPSPRTDISPDPQTAKSPARIPQSDMDTDMEIERLRSYQFPSAMDIPSSVVPSPSGRDSRTPESANLTTGSELNWGTTRTEMMSTSDIATSIGTYGSVSVQETPMTFPDDGSGARTFDLPDIPELSTDRDLQFLEADDTSPVGSQQSQQLDMSVRSRAVAHYLKSQSPSSPSAADLSGILSLNKILEGKSRKICARMFYETLVLKSRGLVDVNQEESYGDISLKLNPELSKGQF